MWKDSIKAISEFLADEPRGELWYAHADMIPASDKPIYGALDPFFPAVLALSDDTGAPGGCRTVDEDVAAARHRPRRINY